MGRNGLAASVMLGAVATLAGGAGFSVHAQTVGKTHSELRQQRATLEPEIEITEETKTKVPAKKLFGAKRQPAPLTPRAYGYYSKGCLAGGTELPKDGSAWQAMRLSRNRNWGHPELVELVKRLAIEAQAAGEWPGLLVGDLSQPRGGPMLTGHQSHQLGLDADVWLMPMPKKRLTLRQREKISAVSMLSRRDKLKINTSVWTDGHVKLLKRAASYRNVERILVHPTIKKALCDASADPSGADRKWLAKIRPYWGHHYHFHMRIGCPKGSTNCRSQRPVTGDAGCKKEIEYWFALMTPKPKKPGATPQPAVTSKPRPPVTLATLPDQCETVLEASSEPLTLPPVNPLQTLRATHAD